MNARGPQKPSGQHHQSHSANHFAYGRGQDTAQCVVDTPVGKVAAHRDRDQSHRERGQGLQGLDHVLPLEEVETCRAKNVPVIFTEFVCVNSTILSAATRNYRVTAVTEWSGREPPNRPRQPTGCAGTTFGTVCAWTRIRPALGRPIAGADEFEARLGLPHSASFDNLCATEMRIRQQTRAVCRGECRAGPLPNCKKRL